MNISTGNYKKTKSRKQKTLKTRHSLHTTHSPHTQKTTHSPPTTNTVVHDTVEIPTSAVLHLSCSINESPSTSLCTQLEIVSPIVVETNVEDTCFKNKGTLVLDTDDILTDNKNNTNITTKDSNNNSENEPSSNTIVHDTVEKTQT